MGWISGTQNLFCCQLVDGCIFGSSTECFMFLSFYLCMGSYIVLRIWAVMLCDACGDD